MSFLILSLPDGSELEYTLTDEVVTIGRSAENAVLIDDDSASGFHAEIHLENGRYHLKDLGSTNGVRVNGERVHNSVLAPGDLLRFGNVRARFEGAPVPVEAAVSQPGRPAGGSSGFGKPSASQIPDRNSPPSAQAVGFGAHKAEKDPEKMIYTALSVLVVLVALAALGMAFTMS